MTNHPFCRLQALEQTVQRETQNMQSSFLHLLKCLEEYVTPEDTSLERETEVLKGTFQQIRQCLNSMKLIMQKRLYSTNTPVTDTSDEDDIERETLDER